MEKMIVEAQQEGKDRFYVVVDRNGNFFAKSYSWIDAQAIASLPLIVDALKETLKQLEAPDCPVIPDQAMVHGRIYNALNASKGN